MQHAPYGWLQFAKHDHLMILPDRFSGSFPFEVGDPLEFYVETERVQVFAPLLKFLGNQTCTVFVDGSHAAAFIGRTPIAILDITRSPSVHTGLASVTRLGLKRLILLEGRALETASAHERLEARLCSERCAEAGLTLRDFASEPLSDIENARVETIRHGPLLVLLNRGEPRASLLVERGARILPQIPMPALEPELASLMAAAGKATLVAGQAVDHLDWGGEPRKPLAVIEEKALETLMDLGLVCERPGVGNEYWAVEAPPNVRLDTEEIELLRRACRSTDPDGTFLFDDADRLRLTRAQRARLVLVSPWTHACLTASGAALLAGAPMPPEDERFLPLRPNLPGSKERPLQEGAILMSKEITKQTASGSSGMTEA